MTDDRDSAHDEILRRSRRLDWRFLAGGPGLGDVAGSARVSAELRGACEALARSYAVLDAAGERRFDVVVLEDPEPAELSEAVRLLRPSGWVYAEFSGSSRLSRRRRVRRAARELEQVGCREIEVNVHWPTLERSEEIFAAEDVTARRAWLSRRHRRGALRSAVLGAAARPRLLIAFAGVSVVGRTGREGPS